jgi:hypothetical protein
VENVLETDYPSMFSIINNIASPRKVAKKILPAINAELGFNTKVDTVAKVIERYIEKINDGKRFGSDIYAAKSMVAKTQIMVRSDVGIASTRFTNSIGQKLIKVVEYIYSKSEKPFINISFGHSYVTIIVDETNLEKVCKIIGKRHIVYSHKNQAAISLVTPPEVLKVPGYSAYIFNLLGIAGINTSEILSSYNEGILILNENDAREAYIILKNEINRLRKFHATDSV